MIQGELRVTVSMKFIKRTVKNTYVLMTPEQAAATAEYAAQQGKFEDCPVQKLLQIETLPRGRYFGESSLLAKTKREALSEEFSSGAAAANKNGANPVGNHRKLHTASVITNTKTELLVISKVNFLRFISDEGFETMKKECHQRRIAVSQIISSFLKSRQWEQKRHDIIKETIEAQNLAKLLERNKMNGY